jgi:hypothetical protein
MARATWTTAGDVGRNRTIAVTASLGALLVAGWMLFRWSRDRRPRRRAVMAHRG